MSLIEASLDTSAIESECRDLWESSGLYRYQPDHPGPLFSVDTPPPYVSAAHLHVGHAMSYAQAEFVVRYQRMQGKRIFYPMGFDDNGLPTERYVENAHQIDKRTTTRKDFRSLCLQETQRGAQAYEELWRSLGLSVDWSLRYSTIDRHCQATAQKSFLDLFKKGRIYRSDEPVLWDTHFQTALAQADLDSLSRRSKLHDLAFTGPGGLDLIISTTRPELLPGCVALYCHPEDPRYHAFIGQKATVPLFGHTVLIRSDDQVDPEFGTGLMMVCTFGDAEDVRRWKADRLDTRLCIGPDGRMTETAGDFAGLDTTQARAAIVRALKTSGHHRGARRIAQVVAIAERSQTPVEFAMVPQWFIRVLDLKEALLERSAQLQWHPEWMKTRLDHWISGLKWDWNISRQRFYGVPFPVWSCDGCAAVILAGEGNLPVDPLEDAPPVACCPSCGCTELSGEPDVMDTWMTSSLTPLINANWASTENRAGTLEIHPMTVRVQGFEIIRTWLFYTLLKGHLHQDSLPWRDVMISGWGLNEQGKKISKRDLMKSTDKTGFNRYNPSEVIRKYGADALRHWAAGSHLGHDLKYQEKAVRAGRKLVVKLWNAARFISMNLTDFDATAPQPCLAERMPEDLSLLSDLQGVIRTVSDGFERYDYAVGREALDRFFWGTFCDDYLEMVKDRFWHPERYSSTARQAAQATLWSALRTLLGLYAPFLPFVTEALYQRLYRQTEGTASLHITSFPTPTPAWEREVPEMKVVQTMLRAIRSLRTERRIPQTRGLISLTLDLTDAPREVQETIHAMERTIQAVSRAEQVLYGSAAQPADDLGIRIDLVPKPKRVAS